LGEGSAGDFFEEKVGRGGERGIGGFAGVFGGCFEKVGVLRWFFAGELWWLVWWMWFVAGWF
jgi:hypothetical protein